ncbi:hypothetical protein [Virgibacillus salarius]
MCGRYTLLADELEILTTFDLDQEAIENYEPSYNIALWTKDLSHYT